jgi:hypothetical protein
MLGSYGLSTGCVFGVMKTLAVTTMTPQRPNHSGAVRSPSAKTVPPQVASAVKKAETAFMYLDIYGLHPVSSASPTTIKSRATTMIRIVLIG